VLHVHIRLRRCEELVYFCVRFRYLLRFLGPSGSSSSLYVNSWFSRYQSSFFVVLQVLHLDCQICKQGYAVISVLFLPLRYVVVFEHVRILSDVLAPLKGVALLDVVQREELIVFPALVVHAEMN
jgi:hypothetical protein